MKKMMGQFIPSLFFHEVLICIPIYAVLPEIGSTDFER